MSANTETTIEHDDHSAPMLLRILDHQATAADKLLILADTPEHARQWAFQHRINRADCLVVTSTEHLRGVVTAKHPRVRIWSFDRNRNADTINKALAARDGATAPKHPSFG